MHVHDLQCSAVKNECTSSDTSAFRAVVEWNTIHKFKRFIHYSRYTALATERKVALHHGESKERRVEA